MAFPPTSSNKMAILECRVSAPLSIAAEPLSIDQLPPFLRDQSGSDLELPSKQTGWAVDLQRRDGCFANRRSGQDQASAVIQLEMQMPSQQSRLVLSWIEERLRLSAVVVARRSISLGEIASGATQREVRHC